MAQTELVIAQLRVVRPDREVEIRIIKTDGDLDKTSPLTEIGGRGVFTNAIETALLAGGVDAAVHSAKDLPTALHAAAPIVAFPDRDDPRDVLVSRHGVTLDRLPPHPVIGTSSRRRAVQISRLRPDARIVSVRGNIETRLRKAEGLELDAIVLAAAGLHRLGLSERISEYFPVEEMVPSPAQGAIAVQALLGSETAAILQATDDAAVSTPVRIERAFLAAVGAGCTVPIGAYVVASGAGYRLIAMLANDTGDRIAFADEVLAVGDEFAHAAERAARLRSATGMGTASFSQNGAVAHGGDLQGARVVVTRPRRQAGPLISALAARGAMPLPLPTIRVEPVADTAALDAALRDAGRGAYDWIVFTSANAVEMLADRMAALEVLPAQFAALSVAAVGPATAAAVDGIGLQAHLVPANATADALAAELIERARPTARILYPRSAIGRESLPDALRGAGLDVVTLEIYRTRPEEVVDPEVLEIVRRGDFDLIAFASPSSVRGLIGLLGEDRVGLDGVPVVCVGSVTGRAAREAGFRVVAIGDDPAVEAMTETITRYWRNRTRVDDWREETMLTATAANAWVGERSGE